jgi:hypothetical protein
MSLNNLHNDIPVLPPVTFPGLSAEKLIFKSEIDAPIDIVYENYTNFDRRLEWNPDIKDIITKDNRLNQTGSVHSCLVGPYTLDIESLGRLENNERIIYGERLNEFKRLRDVITMYTFEKKEGKTEVMVEIDYKVKSFFGRLIKPMIKKVLTKQTEDTLVRLKKVSEENGQ